MYGSSYYGGQPYGGSGFSRAVTVVKKALNKIVMLTVNRIAVLTGFKERSTMRASTNKAVLKAIDNKTVLGTNNQPTIL